MSSGSTCSSSLTCDGTLVCYSGVCTRGSYEKFYSSTRFIIGSVVGAIILVVILAICITCCIRSRRAKQRRERDQQRRDQLFMSNQQQSQPLIAQYQHPDGIVYPPSPAPVHTSPCPLPYLLPVHDSRCPSPQPSLVSPIVQSPSGYFGGSTPLPATGATELQWESAVNRVHASQNPFVSRESVTELPIDDASHRRGKDESRKNGLLGVASRH